MRRIRPSKSPQPLLPGLKKKELPADVKKTIDKLYKEYEGKQSFPSSIISKIEMIQGPKTLNGWLYKGMSTGLRIGDDYFILTAGNSEILERIYNALGFGGEKFEHTGVKCTVGAYSWMVDDDTEVPEKKEQKEEKLCWFYDNKLDSCFIERANFANYQGKVRKLGPAIKKTTLECKIYLRNQGMTRNEIDELTISTDEAIPF